MCLPLCYVLRPLAFRPAGRADGTSNSVEIDRQGVPALVIIAGNQGQILARERVSKLAHPL